MPIAPTTGLKVVGRVLSRVLSMTNQRAPLGKSATTDVLDWQEVEKSDDLRTVDVFGFGENDRLALGMSRARTMDTAPGVQGDAHAALVDALAKGAAVGKFERRKLKH